MLTDLQRNKLYFLASIVRRKKKRKQKFWSHERPTFRRPSSKERSRARARKRDLRRIGSGFRGTWKMSQPQTPTQNGNNPRNMRKIKRGFGQKHPKDSSAPSHSFSISSPIPSFRGSLDGNGLSPAPFSTGLDTARTNCRRDCDFRVRIRECVVNRSVDFVFLIEITEFLFPSGHWKESAGFRSDHWNEMRFPER